jgi:hypothetical protein
MIFGLPLFPIDVTSTVCIGWSSLKTEEAVISTFSGIEDSGFTF